MKKNKANGPADPGYRDVAVFPDGDSVRGRVFVR